MNHIILKATQRIKTTVDIAEINKAIEMPEKSKNLVKKYMASDKLADDFGYDLLLTLESKLIYGFDYLHKGKKLVIPEINPALIFYSNAVMSIQKLVVFRNYLLSNSPEVGTGDKAINSALFGDFFQLAVNTIVNLQATIETFLNYIIPIDYKFVSKKGSVLKRPSIHFKIDEAVPKIKGKRFESNNQKDYDILKKLIDLRNDIVHLKPIRAETNAKYKKLFRRVIDFKYTQAVVAVKNYVNHYEPNLIEECDCGKKFYYDIISIG